MKAILIPLERVEIEGKIISFDMQKNSVFSVLGKGTSFDKKRYYYFNDELAIDFNDEDTVEFIEFLGGMEGILQPYINEMAIFSDDAEKVFETLKLMNNGAIDSEGEYSTAFLEISVGVYRECTPQSVKEMIEDAEEDGNPMSDADISEEMRRASHWNTVGIGVVGYYC